MTEHVRITCDGPMCEHETLAEDAYENGWLGVWIPDTEHMGEPGESEGKYLDGCSGPCLLEAMRWHLLTVDIETEGHGHGEGMGQGKGQGKG